MAHSALFGAFTVKDEIELGRRFNVQVRSQLPLVEDPEIVDYVRGIIHRLAVVAPKQPFPFTTSVFMHNSINAFAAPGGYIVVNTGLILAMEHESELASVLAHELAHTTQRHIAGRIEQAQVVTLLSLAGALAAAFLGGAEGTQAGVAGAMAAGQSAMLLHSRVDEDEADHIGMNYLTAAGYAPSGMPGAFEKIQRKQWILGVSVPTYLSTHPDVAARVTDLTKRVQRMAPDLRNRKDKDQLFLRIQTLTRARYSDAQIALQHFLQQAKDLIDPRAKGLAFMGQGIIYARLNQIQLANEAFDAALKNAPTDPLIAREAGRFQYMKGDMQKATQLLQQASLANPNDTMALFYYARLLADAGNKHDALKYLQQVMAKHPEDAEVHETFARIAGQEKLLFKAYLHLAYATLYSNKKQQTEKNMLQAKTLAKTPQELDEIKRFEEIYTERRSLW